MNEIKTHLGLAIMKYRHSAIFLLVMLTSCSKIKNETYDEKSLSSTQFGQDLIDIGFLKFADSTKLDSLKSEIINSFYIYNESNYKIGHIDAEELAEFSFDFFMPTLTKILEKRGFKLDVRTASDYERTNRILINGKEITLYSKGELDNGDFWESASRNFFREINSQLDNEKIKESFYLLYTGNDLQAILLTEDEQKIIANNYRDNPKEIPYRP